MNVRRVLAQTHPGRPPPGWRGVPGYDDFPQGRLLDRDLSNLKPFDEKGRGYRDALIWEAVLEVVCNSKGEQQIYFLTRDGDFQTKEGVLHPELLVELGDAAGRVVIAREVKNLLYDHLTYQREAFADQVDEEEQDYLDFEDWPQDVSRTPEEIIEAAVIAAAEDLVGSEVDHFGEVELPRGPDSYDIGSIMVDETTVDVQVYDRVEGETVLAQASVWAEIEFHGYVYKGDFYILDGDNEFIVLDSDWNERYVLVGLSRECRLYFQVRLDSQVIDYVDLEYVEPISNEAGSAGGHPCGH